MVACLDVETNLGDGTCVSGEARATCPCCHQELGLGGNAAGGLKGHHTVL